MAQTKNMTRAEIEQEMQQLRSVFGAVRLLDAEQVNGGAVEGIPPCFAYWKRDHPCENCVAKHALTDNEKKSRLEYIGQDLYQITACSVMVEGRPCVMELSQKLDHSMVLNSGDGERLLDDILRQRERIYRDPLTGAHNKRYYDEIYSRQILTASVAAIDLDDLKLANDVYGHYAGDSVLETAVNVIRRDMGEKDRLIRLEGDELLLVMPEVEEEKLTAKLEQLRLRLYAASVPGYSHLHMSASIGGLWVRETDAATAVQRAEKLMKYAQMQKNTVITERLPQQDEESGGRRQSVLIVDDSEVNRRMLSRMLAGQYDTAEAASGEDCLHLLEQNPRGISIVLLDIHMTGIDGFAVLETMKRRRLLEEIPVIMISSEDTADTVRRSFDLGAADYISRPFDAAVVYRRVSNTIRLYAKQRRLSAMAAEQAYEKEKTSRMMIGILSQVVENRNGESRSHVQRVSHLTEMLLERISQMTDRYLLPKESRRIISEAAALHDIGKMEISEELLNKQGTLTAEELKIMQSHTLLGAKMIEELDTYRDEKFVRAAYQICRWHHERYDGSGYPDHLQGEQIPIAAQVVGLADVYERLVAKPVDGHMRTHRQALRDICSGSCGAFSPLLLECMQDIETEIEEAMKKQDDTL